MTTRGKKEYSRNEEMRRYVDDEAKKITREEASKETSANPGTIEKVIILRARVIHGLPLFLEKRQEIFRELIEEDLFW